MTKHQRRRLRAAVARMMAIEQLWAIHEPSLHALLGQIATQGGGSDPVTTQMVGQVAILPIVGVLQQKASWVTRYMGWTATEILERDFRAAANDSQVKAIVLYCDSPGGAALGNEEVARTIHQARGKKPILAFTRGLCASACYWLACQADKIIASPSSCIGSIGAILIHTEYSKAYEQLGIGVNVIRHGSNKQLGNSYEPLKPEARAKLQKWIDDVGMQFEAAVARGRDVSASDVRSKYGQGDVFLAPEAKERGLIDGVASWEQVLASLKAGPAPLPQPGEALDRIIVRGVRQRTAATISFSDEVLPGWTAEDEAAYAAGAAADWAADFTDDTDPTGLSSALSASSSTLPSFDEQPTSPAAAATSKDPQPMNKRIKAILMARGLIDSLEASDELCKSLLSAWFGSTGQDVPAAEADIIKGLMVVTKEELAAGHSRPVPGGLAAPAVAAAGDNSRLIQVGAGGAVVTALGGAAIGAAANVQAAHDAEMAEAKRLGIKSEQQRQKAIRASGSLLKLPEATVQAAIDGGQDHSAIIAAWHTELVNKDKPISQGSQPTVGQEGIERYAADAELAMAIHYGVPLSEGAKVTPQIRQLAKAPLVVHAAQSLQAAGIRFDPYDKEAICQAAMEMDGVGHVRIDADAGIPSSRPGSFPNLLSNLFNKVLDLGPEQADVTYDEWTGVKPTDLPDFKPVPIVAKGQYGETDEVLDAEEFKEQKLDEELLSYLQLARYGNSFALTPLMAANDDLDAFREDLIGLSEGWELKQNRGCLNLITGNVYLLDTYQLYDNTNHGNYISSGGNPPSDSEWDAMELKMNAQTTIGSKAYMRGNLAIALVPPAQWRAAVQAFMNPRNAFEAKAAAADTSLNVYRGLVTVVKEPELTATSTTEWYGFMDPRRFRNATVVRAYFAGFPRSGRRERWYDPRNKCWYVSLEGRVGFAAKNYRTTIKDKGAA